MLSVLLCRPTYAKGLLCVPSQAMGVFTGLSGNGALVQAMALTRDMLGTMDSWWGEVGVHAGFSELPTEHHET